MEGVNSKLKVELEHLISKLEQNVQKFKQRKEQERMAYGSYYGGQQTGLQSDEVKAKNKELKTAQNRT